MKRFVIFAVLIIIFFSNIISAEKEINFDGARDIGELSINPQIKETKFFLFNNQRLEIMKEKIEIDLDDVKLFSSFQDYDMIAIEDCSFSSKPGYPKVPMKVIKFELPRNSELVEVKIKGGQYRPITNKINIVPVSEPILWDIIKELSNQELNKLKPNSIVYSSDNLFPGKIINYFSGEDKDTNYVIINFFPLQIKPSENKGILITELEYEIIYTKKEEKKTFSTPLFYVSSAENIIITPFEFSSTAQELADIHSNEGVESEVITTSWIFEHYPEVEDAPFDGYKNPSNEGWSEIENYNYSLSKKIISFLRDDSAHPNLEYVTIMGNGINVPPSYYFLYGEGGYDSWIPSDFFYTSPDYDLIPNYKVGRLPVNDISESDFLVDKIHKWIIDVEWDWFENVAVAGDNAFGTYYYVGELIMTDAINQNSFNGMDITKYFGSDDNFDEEHISSPLINGNSGIFYQIGHGSGTSMGTDDGSITVEDLLSYHQNNKQPILITINCLNGAFDTYLMDTDYYGNPFPYGYSFSEASLMSEAGAIAYIGGTRTNYGGIDITLTNGSFSINSQPYMQSMLNYVVKGYHEGNNHLGEITDYALNSFVAEKDFSDDINYKTLFGFILLGDPVLKLPPQQIKDSYQKPQLNSLNAENYVENWNGNMPMYYTDREIIIKSETNSPYIGMKVIDTYMQDIIYEITDSIIDEEYVYEFILNNERYKPYQIRTLTEDGKEGWFYLMVEEESGIPINPNQILVVDDDIGDSLEDYYTDSLVNSGYSFDVWNVISLGSPDYDVLSKYRVVIWFTGNDWLTTLTFEDQNNLANYLDNGGNLFISGQDIGYNIGETFFYQDYLYAQYVGDDTNIYVLEGVVGDPITSYMQINISGGDGANNQYYPSEIDPINGATSIFYYEETTEPFELYSEKFNEKEQEKNYFSLNSSGSGGLRIDNGIYKAVYLAFGFEAINNQDDRNFLMKKIVDYLYYLDESPPRLGKSFAELGENQPGGLITLNVYVHDESEIEYVKADIKKDGEIVNTLTLYDDGLHDDEGEGDGVYGNNWFADEENNFSVDISSSDEYDNSIVYEDILRFTSTPFVTSSKIIVIHNEKYTNLYKYYTKALSNNSYEFDIYDIQERGRPYSYLYDAYENGVVIWLTGNDWSTTLSKKDQNNLARYLDIGGTLFISGQDIGYDLTKYGSVNNSFFTNYLHAEFIKDNVNLNMLNGIYGNEISEWMTINISGGDGANNQYYPSEIDPINGAMSVFIYDINSEYSFGMSDVYGYDYDTANRPNDVFGISSTGSGAISYENNVYKLVYFSFGFEAISNDSNRNELMRGIINWFDFCTPNWTLEENWSECTIEDLQFKDWMDLNSCGNNSTKPSLINQTCDYCTPINIQINESCNLDDAFTSWYNDTRECYEQTGLDSDKPLENITYECNYCFEEIQGPFYTEWSLCMVNDAQTKIKYYEDKNYDICCAITGLESDCNIDNETYQNSTETNPCDYCTPNWIEIIECQSDDALLIDYIDSNNCHIQTGLESDLEGKLENITHKFSCDYNNDGFIGNKTNINTNLSNLTLEKENNLIKLKENNKTIIEFEFNLTEGKINLANLSLEKQSNESTCAYMVINGLDLISQNQTKIVYLDRILNGTGICIKDEELFSISEVSDSCIGENEIWLDCNGAVNNYTCELINNETQYKISGLKHSGVKEQETYCGDGACNGNEVCGVCVADCGTCPMENPPANTDGGGGGGGGSSSNFIKECVEDWECTVWEKCTTKGIQTRVCIDLYDCGTNKTKPIIIKECFFQLQNDTITDIDEPEPKEENLTWLWAIILVGCIFLYFFGSNFLKNRKKGGKNG